MAECPHKSTYWTQWKSIPGITKNIEYRDKRCRDCGRTVDREAK